MYINKWHTFAAACLLQLVSGICYTFSLYSPELKKQLQYDQRQLQAVGAALLAGGYTSWIPGLLYDGLVQRHHKLAPRLMGCLGIIFHVAGWGGLWLAATHRVALSFPMVVACACLSSMAIVWFDTADIVTCMLNFPAHGGDVAGILKAFLGLSASVATAIYTGYFAPRAVDFLAFLAVGPALLAAGCIPFLNHVPHTQHSEAAHDSLGLTSSGRFGVICLGVASIITYQAASAAAGALVPGADSPRVQFWLMIGVLALLACTILGVPVGSGSLHSKPAAPPLGSQPGGQDPLLTEEAAQPDPEAAKAGPRGSNLHRRRSTSSALLATEAAEASAGAVKGLGPNPTLLQSVTALDFWLLWTSLFIGTGAGFVLLNNLGQMVESLGGPPGGQDILVLMFTTANCLGRLACGWASEALLHSYGLPRTVFTIWGAAGWAVVLFFTAYAPLNLLPLTAGFGGFVFGCHWPLMPSLTAELFGLRHFAANQCPISFATAMGSLVLSQQLTARLYQSHVPPGESNCYGKYCFREAMLILGTIAALQTVAAYVLYVRTKLFYRRKFEAIQQAMQVADD